MDRIGDYMATYSGKRFYPLDPRPEDVDIRDIAHALALNNRYNGHSRFPYSVGYHSILCSLCVKEGFELEALLHDATEAYLCDLVRPAKNGMPEYKEIEDNIWRKAIAPKFFLDPELPKEVHEVDNRMLVTEARQIMSQADPWWFDPQWPEPFDYVVIDPNTNWKTIEGDFLRKFYELYARRYGQPSFEV